MQKGTAPVSNKYINDAIAQASSIKDPSAAHILLVLANHADEHGECWPSHQLIAKETGLGIATVKRKLDVLKQQERVQWTTGRGKKAGNRYRLIAHNLSDLADRPNRSSSHANSSSSTETAAQIAHPVTDNSSPVSYEPTENPQKKENPHINDAPSALPLDGHMNGNGFANEAKQASGHPNKEGKEASEAFKQFWAAYPRHVGQLAARKVWDKALKEAPADQIIDGARRYAAERQDENPKYTKHPATWLNGGCWMDEPGANSHREKNYAEIAEELRNASSLEEWATNGSSGPALDLRPDEWAKH
jgi:helix-turn-helix protein